MSYLITRNYLNPSRRTFTNNFLNDFYSGRRRHLENCCTNQWSAPVDITENENGYLLTMDLPGLTKDDVNMSVEKGVLTISGERKTEINEESEKVHFTERYSGEFQRSFRLGETVNTDEISAKLTNGVLEVRIPKREAVLPKQIPVVS